jgi:hypothetical protein
MPKVIKPTDVAMPNSYAANMISRTVSGLAQRMMTGNKWGIVLERKNDGNFRKN